MPPEPGAGLYLPVASSKTGMRQPCMLRSLSWKITSNLALWVTSVALSLMKQQWALVPLNGQQVELVPQVRV